MRAEFHKGRWLLCGVILPGDLIKPGQVWVSSGNNTVRVTDVEVSTDGHYLIKYEWDERGEVRSHEKWMFAFQCRYCLALENSTIPEDICREIYGNTEENWHA